MARRQTKTAAPKEEFKLPRAKIFKEFNSPCDAKIKVIPEGEKKLEFFTLRQTWKEDDGSKRGKKCETDIELETDDARALAEFILKTLDA